MDDGGIYKDIRGFWPRFLGILDIFGFFVPCIKLHLCCFKSNPILAPGMEPYPGTVYGRKLADMALAIEAIVLRPNNPFLWASGYRMPIYNDNRRHLGVPANRDLYRDAFMHCIRVNKLSFDMIAGTTTAGIAPATLLADACDVPLVIMHGEDAYAFNNLFSDSITQRLSRESTRAVATNCPWGIPYGISMADYRKVPFMYVRNQAKGHGLEQQIEGIVKSGEVVDLLFAYRRDTAVGVNTIEKALTSAGLTIGDVAMEEHRDAPIDVFGKKILVVEDLVSTGGSSVSEVQAFRDKGAIVTDCLSIFSYGFPQAVAMFAGQQPFKDGKVLDAPCALRPLFDYTVLLDVVKKRGTFDHDDLAMLDAWNKDPFGWGKAHGFPKVEK